MDKGPFPTITASLLLRKEPVINPNRRSSLDTLMESLPVEEDPVYTDEEYWLAAQHVEDVDRRKGRISKLTKSDSGIDMGEYRLKVYRLGHDTLQFLGIIEAVLFRTEFLASYPEFSFYSTLVKVMLFEVIRKQFNYTRSGIQYKFTNDNNYKIVREISEALKACKIKLAACYSRLRIERRASGDDPISQLKNALSKEERSKDDLSGNIPKYIRINFLKTDKVHFWNELRKLGVDMLEMAQESNPAFRIDRMINGFFQILPALSERLRNSSLIKDNLVLFHDKISCLPGIFVNQLIQELMKKSEPDEGFQESRKVSFDEASLNQLSTHQAPQEIYPDSATFEFQKMEIGFIRPRMGLSLQQIYSDAPDGISKVYAFEEKNAEALMDRLTNLGMDTNEKVQVIPSDFMSIDPFDIRFRKMSCLVCEPPSTFTGIIDQYEYMLEEGEYPFAQYSKDDILLLQNFQLATLEHAAKCNSIISYQVPNLKYIFYISRSDEDEENEDVVEKFMESPDWQFRELKLEGIKSISECIKLESNSMQNGIFISCFERIQNFPAIPEEMRLNEVIEAQVKKKSIRKHNAERKKKRKNSYLIPTFASQMRTYGASLDDLYIQKQVKGEVSPKQEESVFSKSSSMNNSPRTRRNTYQATAIKSNPVHVSLEVFGKGLARFYEKWKRMQGVMDGNEILTVDPKNRWIYPIPNPNHWK